MKAHLVWAIVAIVVLGDTGCARLPRGSLIDLGLSELAAIPDSELHSLAAALCGMEWRNVSKAAFALEAKQERAIPTLLSILDRDEYVKLRNTADLIYPGADTYYGHGGILNYDIDWLPVRAGWVLEETTFQDFGFSEIGIDHDALLTATARGQVDVPLDTVTSINRDPSSRQRHRSSAADLARRWWSDREHGWNRLSGLIEALESGESRRVLAALHWLRFEESPIDGFSRQVYVDVVYPIVVRLSASADAAVAEQTAYLTRDFADEDPSRVSWKKRNGVTSC